MKTKNLALPLLLLIALDTRAQTYDVYDLPSGGNALHSAINSQGVVAGYDGIASFIRAADGTLTMLQNIAPNAINASGTVVGNGRIGASLTPKSYVRTSDGTTTQYAPKILGTQNITLSAINSSGAFAGSFDASNSAAGVLQLPGNDPPVVFSGDANTVVTGMNDLDQVTANVSYAHYAHALIRNADGTTITFQAPTASGGRVSDRRRHYTYVYGINNDGDAVGTAYTYVEAPYYASWSDERGFIRHADGTFDVFEVAPTLGGYYYSGTLATAINSSRTVIGTANYHGFVRDAAGTVTMFDVPNMVSTVPMSINDAGVISGICVDAAGMSHFFLRFP